MFINLINVIMKNIFFKKNNWLLYFNILVNRILSPPSHPRRRSRRGWEGGKNLTNFTKFDVCKNH